MEGLSVHYHKDYVEIILDRPKAGNSFGLQQAQKLREEISKINEYALLVFRSGEGVNFCAGGNLSFYANKSAKEGAEANRVIYESLQQIKASHPVSLCIVEGNCFGGGMELISCFDFIISTPHSYFGFWQRKIALSFGWGGRLRWTERLSSSQIKTLSLEAKSISSYKAKEMNIVDAIVPKHKIDNYILDWVLRQKELPRASVATIKSTAGSEREEFDKLWFNSEHQQILDPYKKP